MNLSVARCGSCRKLRAQECCEGKSGGQCCREFEPFGEWLLMEIGRVERHLRHATAWAGLLVGAMAVSIAWVLMTG